MNSTHRCGVYLAPASIKSAGLGIFAGVDYPTGSRIGSLPSTIGIQVTDPVALYRAEELVSEFGWSAASVGGFAEADLGDVFTLLIGDSGAMLTNFHPTLGNVLPGGLAFNSNGDRSSPGTGAFTSYDNFTFVAKTDIGAGQEILASVHDNWYDDFLKEKKPGIFVPTKDDYQRADKLVTRLAEFRRNHDGHVSDAQFLDMLLRIKTEMMSSPESKSNPQDANIIGLLPSSLSEFHASSEKGTARSQLNERSLDWLERNGRCLDDTIASGTSHTPNAGRGAFAKRAIAEGSIITTIPLVQVMDKANLNIDVEFMQGYHQVAVSNRQLLINYCFGHRKSEMLLCPTTSAALVNHGTAKANARLRWSDFPRSYSASSDARGGIDSRRAVPPYMASLDEIDPRKMGTDAKLVFDLIATRDIAEGEEIFMDYGSEWEEAWDQHVHSYDTGSSHDYVPANVMNSEERPILLSSDPDLVHHNYLCRLEPFAREDSIKTMPVEDYRANPSMEPDGWGDYTRTMYADNDYIWWWPCDVVAIDRDSSGGRPTYQTIVYEKGSIDDGREPRVIRKLKNVPRTGIKFVDKPYHSNQHLPSAFRHYIPIPDDIFPLHWRNDYKTAENLGLGSKNVGDEDHSRADEDAYEKSLREAKCGVWVAPSNIKGAGNGIFLGIDTPGSGYVLGTTFPVIPFSDITDREHWDAADYTWASSSFETEFETGSKGTNQIQSVNAGSLANFHPGLVNYVTGDARYNPILDRRSDPGAGSFSDYRGFSFTSRYEVRKGEEVYISYGESWFSSRSYLGAIPLSANYNEANQIVASLVSTTREGDANAHGAPGLDADSATDFLSIVKDDVISNGRTKKVLEPYASYQDVRTRILGRNGTAEATTENKSQDWLEENGYCIDNIYSRLSTIEQAGIGAFARRRMAKGDVIIPAPLLATYGRHMFNLKGRHVPDDANKVNLALNYQFSHPESSLHLFPTTSALLVNHRSANQRWGGIKPNAELRWSTTDRKSVYFLQRTLEDLRKEHYTTLVIDIVATRTIEPDEEITIDYGDNWTDAWERHIASFKSPCPPKSDGAPCFKSSKVVHEMNDDKFNADNQAWSEDHFTACRRSEMPRTDEAVIFLVPKPKNITYTKREVVHIDEDGIEYRWSFRGIEFDHEGFDLASTPSDWYPCLVLSSSEDDKTFDVVYFTFETSSLEDEEANVLRRARMLNAEDIKFLNKPYKSDMYWEGAFRHPIEIPDSIFPPLWKDLAA